jgi:hypothetical protein
MQVFRAAFEAAGLDAPAMSDLFERGALHLPPTFLDDDPEAL